MNASSSNLLGAIYTVPSVFKVTARLSGTISFPSRTLVYYRFGSIAVIGLLYLSYNFPFNSTRLALSISGAFVSL